MCPKKALMSLSRTNLSGDIPIYCSPCCAKCPDKSNKSLGETVKESATTECRSKIRLNMHKAYVCSYIVRLLATISEIVMQLQSDAHQAVGHGTVEFG